jgi:hypothetical protein
VAVLKYGTDLVARKVPCGINLEELWPSLLINSDEHGDNSKGAHVGMLYAQQFTEGVGEWVGQDGYLQHKQHG